ncbi:MAG TPA: PQQ-binding-like beta-propeller repeat protein [Thermoleophilaceae bacterium]
MVSYRGNPQHTESSSDDSVFGPLVRLWTRNFDAPPSQPLIVEGRVLINVPNRNPSSGPYGSQVVALDPATGKEIWRQPTPGTYFTSHIAIDRDRVVSVNFDGVARAFAVSDGRPLWTRELGQADSSLSVWTAPVARGGTAFVVAGSSGAYQSTVYALDTSSGALRWSSGVGIDDEAMPALDDERVLVSDACGNAAALRQSDGTVAWNRQRDAQCGNGTAGVLSGGRLFTRSATGWIYDAATGADRGTLPGGAPDAVAGDLGILGITGQGAVRAIDLGTGAIRWTFTQKGSYEFPLRPIAVGETVFATTPKGRLVGLDRTTGRLRWSAPLKGNTYSSIGGPLPGMSAGHGVLVATAGTLLHGYAPVLRPSARGIDMAASTLDVTVGRRVLIVGGLGPALRAGRPQTVQLEADRHPFGRYNRIARGRTAADGTVYFRVRPKRNTRYRVRLPGGPAAAPLHIYAYPRTNWRYRRGRTRLRVSISMAAGSDFRVGGRRLAIYLFRHKRHKHPRLGTTRVVQTGPGRARATVTFPYPRRVARKDSLTWCIEGLRGFARPRDPFQRHCGASVVRY